MTANDAPADVNEVSILLSRGTINVSVQEFVRELVAHHPKVVWREPVPTRVRIGRSNGEYPGDPFLGLWAVPNKVGSTLTNCLQIPLDEARLSWSNDERVTSIHIVSDNYGSNRATTSQWATVWETGAVPEWFAHSRLQSTQTDHVTVGCLRKRHQVFPLDPSESPSLKPLRVSLRRFGKERVADSQGNRIEILEYVKDGICMAFAYASTFAAR